jgi:FixJ family two-component response regulator
MNHIDLSVGRRSLRHGAALAPESQTTGALVHVVDVDDEAQRLLTLWLAAAGIESRTYAHLGTFLDAQRDDVPGCLVIDAQPPAISGLEQQAILLPLAVRCPIVVTTCQVDVRMAGRFMNTGEINFVRKPLRQHEVVTAISAALEVDRQQRLMASRRAELRARFATLSGREREVMTLVAAGMANKLIAADLDISIITVKAHRGAAMRKMRARTLADLVRMADVVGDDTSTVRSGHSTPTRSAVAAGRHSGYILAPGRPLSSPMEALCRAR